MKLFVYEFASSVVWEELPTSIRREGRAMFDAVCADAAASSLVGLDQVIAFESVPPAQERSLLEQAAREADWSLIIAPEFDGLLEQRLGWALEAGGRLLGPGLAAVRLTTDKYVLAQHWQQQGIPTPLTWLDEAAPPVPGPYVSKWRDGAGSQEMRLSTEMNPRGSRFIWQPFHSGKPVSVAFLAGPGGTLMPLLAGWQRLATQGRFHYAGGVLPIPEPLAKRATELARRALATVPDLLGYVSVDLLLDEGDNPANDVVIEINPRLSTSYLGLRAMSRKNLFTLMLAHAQGEELLPAWKSGSVEFAIDGQVQWHDGPAVAPPSA